MSVTSSLFCNVKDGVSIHKAGIDITFTVKESCALLKKSTIHLLQIFYICISIKCVMFVLM